MPPEFTPPRPGAAGPLGPPAGGGAAHRLRRDAAHWIAAADRVWRYRRDRLREPERGELRARREALRDALRTGADAGKLRLLIDETAETLGRLGGTAHPKTILAEAVELLLVAAVIILGVRTYFLQPFKIPTNSMWPTYHGLTATVYRTPAERPGAAARLLRSITLLAEHHAMLAPASGEVSADFFENGEPAYQELDGRSRLLFPETLHRYTLHVGDAPVAVDLPEDFRFASVLAGAFFSGQPDLQARLRSETERGAAEPELVVVRPGTQPVRSYRVGLGRKVQAGAMLLCFDVLAGDRVLVDRMSYHFVRPAVGQGFVFRTDHIPALADTGGPMRQYFVKRLAGVAGDTLEIRDHRLIRNGRPAAGAAAFEWNARRTGDYPGYQNFGALAAGKMMTVPPGHFLALGDNSPDSKDGRYWGYVPEKDVIGRPLLVYFPFTSRWGPAR